MSIDMTELHLNPIQNSFSGQPRLQDHGFAGVTLRGQMIAEEAMQVIKKLQKHTPPALGREAAVSLITPPDLYSIKSVRK